MFYFVQEVAKRDNLNKGNMPTFVVQAAAATENAK
jgi:hypothetical protein